MVKSRLIKQKISNLCEKGIICSQTCNEASILYGQISFVS